MAEYQTVGPRRGHLVLGRVLIYDWNISPPLIVLTTLTLLPNGHLLFSFQFLITSYVLVEFCEVLRFFGFIGIC